MGMNVTRQGALVLALGLVQVAWAEEDLSGSYDLDTKGSSSAVPAGGEGHLILAIRAKGETHAPEEAPLKVSLSGTDVHWSKTTLSRGALKPEAGSSSPRFDVPFHVGAGPRATAEAKVVFFLCSKDL